MIGRIVRIAVSVALVIAALGFVHGAGAAVRHDEIRERAKQICADDDYQQVEYQEQDSMEDLPIDHEPARPTQSIAWVLLVTLGVCVAGLIIAASIGAWKRRTAVAEQLQATQAAGTCPAGALVQLADVERLAAAGAFGVALHLLLMLAIQKLAAARDLRLSPAQTSRELIRLLPRTPPEQETFAALVALVERGWFGTERLSDPEYRQGLTWYRELSA